MTGITDGTPEANVRAAYSYLSDMVRKFADHSAITLLNKLQIAETAMALGPQVTEYAAAGLCFYCGRREREGGYFTCEDCNNLDNEVARARAIEQHRPEGVSAGCTADTAGAPVSPVQATDHAGDRVSPVTDDMVAVGLQAVVALGCDDGCDPDCSCREIDDKDRADLQLFVRTALSAALAGSTLPAVAPSRSVVTVDEVTFHGCDNSNPDLCNCGSWEPPTCDACDEELAPGEEVFFTQLQGLPWLPAGHRDQEHANWLWHVKCDQRAGGSQVGDQHGGEVIKP